MKDAVRAAVEDAGLAAAEQARDAAKLHKMQGGDPVVVLAWLKVVAEAERILGAEAPETPK